MKTISTFVVATAMGLTLASTAYAAGEYGPAPEIDYSPTQEAPVQTGRSVYTAPYRGSQAIPASPRDEPAAAFTGRDR